MSIVLERGKGIGGTGYVGGLPCFPACESLAAVEMAASRSSSIGRNSDCSSAEVGGGEEGGEAEVQSSYKGPLETMDALEDSLPIRRGISKFYCGKSKSFASLSDATSKLSSAKELGKPENPYSRKRKNLLAMSSRWETPDSEGSIGFLSKRHANSSRRIAGTPTTAPVSSPTSSSTSNCSVGGRDQFRLLPPLHPFVRRSASPWASPPLPEEIEGHSFSVRSFSLMDLQGMESLSSSSSSSSIGSELHKEFS